MQFLIHDHRIDITCDVNELFTMHERGMAIYGMLPPTGNSNRVMRPYIAAKPRHYYDPVLATWQDFHRTEADGSGYITITVARDRLHPNGPLVTGANRDGQMDFGFKR